MFKNRILNYIAGLIVLGALIFVVVSVTRGQEDEVRPYATPYTTPRGQQSNNNDNDAPPASGLAIPRTLSLAVPFTPQAPTANWDELHNEACEEASAIMVDAFFDGKGDGTLDPVYVEDQISKITEWEKKTFGYYLDIDSEETARLLREIYDLKTEVIQDYSETDIKQALTDGKLVILSLNGRMLGNPNFRPPGPIYHMLVVRGWNANEFITNDPGTRKGKNYPYTWDTLHSAAAEWDHDQHSTDNSIKKAILVWK